MGDRIMHTHQYGGYQGFELDEAGRQRGINPTNTQIAAAGQDQIKQATASGGKVHKAVFDMSDASAEKAIEFQKSQLGKNPGPYDIRTRSCLTHVMEVLAAGDVDVPDSAMRQYGFIQKKLGLSKCKQRGD